MLKKCHNKLFFWGGGQELFELTHYTCYLEGKSI